MPAGDALSSAREFPLALAFGNRNGKHRAAPGDGDQLQRRACGGQAELGALLDHKAKSRKQQQAQDNSFEGYFVDPSEQDDTYGRSSSQGWQSNAKVDQNL